MSRDAELARAITPGHVVAVLLADGWHRVVPGSFGVGPLSFGAGAGPGTPGFRFEQADPASPCGPATLAGPLGSILAVRQLTSAGRLSGVLPHADVRRSRPALEVVPRWALPAGPVGGSRPDHRGSPG